ncbi:MAG: protein-(glutamine-N5) methyltransferase, release factor-specific [Polynucleobacter sp. 24-46-87]|jgi:release factor glutamine methyltransferase|uniref:peptide chain release factor N(5)-glutamine methyltransferase n=1 Tax=unclassified Polynucleobacter TaxID=2640945 RepID=UPI000BDD7620|nr:MULTISPECIES: peptide chain release factor N(5)-glutamine methyltransferase [unclassified Polynucleobacter]OYY16698.1 MAG: protein-(glutamine-N5) methyltransferase, release factor-specific [Polynucleobacter sp. 35-46-11]OZA15191.1 MAG: protein-(glutamine-N5) methyltransferase, release factor-specific [Polynucleobacter sp. 24-46-87]OZA76830.1 MAG: protein-(glutamine-N5) methyltransferase, release factor-specific [Polynucleobacter sp. 39-46-10]
MSLSQSLRELISNCTLPANEARILLAHLLEKHYQLPRSALLSRDDMSLDEQAFQEWDSLVSRRVNGEPIAYILGKKGFHNIELQVGPGVLIPRPETELLVEIALTAITKLNKPTKVLDLGTGSGAIALSIANASPLALVSATDQSIEALVIAKQNAELLNLTKQVQFFQGSWYEALDQTCQFDVIVSNPPYIANQDSHLTQGDLRFEPESALTDYANGLSCLEIIIAGVDKRLKAGGLIAVEHGFDQSEAVVKLMKGAGLIDVQAHLDLAGHRRVASGQKRL